MLFENCNNCGQTVAQNDKFCKKCGVSLSEQFVVCTNCHRRNTMTASFCGVCGNALKTSEDYEKKYLGLWMNALRNRIMQDHQAQNLEDYLENFYANGFHKTFLNSAKQLGKEVAELEAINDRQSAKKIQTLEYHRIENLLDYFIIHHCKDFNTIHFSEKILKYQNIQLEELELVKMILDYLNLEQEEFTFYTDFLLMPVDSLKNASKYFLFPEKDEKIWLICDLSGMDNFKEGFAFTEKALYWKAPFEKAQRVHFFNLDKIMIEENWLLINNSFFNANTTLNLKLLYLLRKLKRLFVK